MGRDVQAPEPVIQDACQFAWSSLVHHRGHVRRETVLGWLVTTAVREALRLRRRSDREVSLEAMLEEGGDLDAPRGRRSIEELVEARERLKLVSSLAPRQQRVLWLHALGLSYAEIAREDGCTERTVERQLYRARTRLRANDSSVRDFGSR